MVCNVIYLYRPESAQPDVKGHKTNVDTLVFQLFEQFRRKMQAGSRGGGRADLTRVDGLVAFLIF